MTKNPQVEKRKLSEVWKELNTRFTGLMVYTPESLKELASLLLEVLSLLCDEKVRIIAQLKSMPQPDIQEYGRRISQMVGKGMAYEERKMMMELSVGTETWDKIKRLEVLNEIENACRRYESMLRILHDSMKLDLKLSFEGHN